MANSARNNEDAERSAGATIRRISSLGLTLEEATGWYRNNMVGDFGKAFLISILALILALVALTPTYALLESSLMTHVTVHLLFVMVGALIAYAVHWVAVGGFNVRFSLMYEAFMEVTSKINVYGILYFVLAGSLVYYWMTPSNFDAAVLNELTHLEMHFTFLFVGVLIFIGSRFLPFHAVRLAPLVVGKVMGLAGTFLLLTTKHLYSVYPAWEQTETGVILLFAMLLLDVTLLPCWLYGYFGNNSNAAKLNVKGMTDQSSNQNY